MTPEQQAVFDKVKAMLAAHVPPFVVIKDEPGDYQLTGPKPVTFGKRKMDSAWFAGLAANKGGITLHYMPIYGDSTLGSQLSPIFMKTLKGKACFHLGKFGPELERATEEAIRVGVEAYRSRDWV